MSWQRILRFAKVRQVPVIITDDTGEDPMILLSLDQLEQALDGGASPEIPPQPPVPRGATPSFMPEESDVTPDTHQVTSEESAPASPLSAIEVVVPPTAGALEPEEVIASAVSAATEMVEEREPEHSVISTEHTAFPTSLERVLEPEIMTLPAVAPEQPERETSPVVVPPSEVTPTSSVVEATRPATQAADMSLEERFFLEY